MNKTIVYDLDDTLITCTPDKKDILFIFHREILILNELYGKGYTIIIYTGRNWDKYDITIKQLNHCKIKYHQLIMGKPQGYYIDATNNHNTGKGFL